MKRDGHLRCKWCGRKLLYVESTFPTYLHAWSGRRFCNQGISTVAEVA